MNKRMSAVAILIAPIFAAACLAAEPRDENKPSFWMEKKLEYSNKVLAGLAKEDFAAIAAAARSMSTLNQMEKWARGGLPEYRAQLQIFQNADQQLIRTADAENLNGATLAYIQWTLACVNCHKVVRDIVRQDAK